MRILLQKTVLGFLFLFGAALALAADWPQWRGPNRDGISAETGLLKEWPKDGPKLLWQTHDLGSGYSTPAVVGDRLYVISNTGMDDEHVQALSATDGKQVWSTRIGKVGPNQRMNYPGSRSTPTVEGEFLYALGSDGDLACLETKTGVIRWHKSLRKDFTGEPGMWAYSESPLIDGESLICTPGGKEATMAAVNKNTGQTMWKSAVPGGDKAGYASPIRVEGGGRTQYVTFVEKGVIGVDAPTGKFLWRYNQTGKGPANIPTPVAHDGTIYSSSAMPGAGGLIKLKPSSDGVEAEQVYFERGLPSNIGGAVKVGEYLYGTGGQDQTKQGLMCVEFATGKIKWQDKTLGAASVCYADGNLYLHCEDGKVALVEATPEGYRNKGMFTPPSTPKHTLPMQKAWCYPVVANGKLFIRDLDSMWCYDVGSAK